LRALWFGTYDRAHARNAQAMSALRRAGVEVLERHVDLWNGRDRLGTFAAYRIAAAELRLMMPRRRTFDVVVVGYPGHFDMPQARNAAGPKPLVFLPSVSLSHELIERRGRFQPRSMTARLLEATDVRALKLADTIVADTNVSAAYLAEAGAVPLERVTRIFAGAEERVFCERWSPAYPFGVLHVAGSGTSLEPLLAAARLVPDLPIRVAGSELPDSPPNVEWLRAPYDELGLAYAHAGIAVAALDESLEIPQAAFDALATGTPLVTADTHAARELLVDEESALLVPPGDPEAAADTLRRIADDDDLQRRLSRGGRRLYESCASEDVLGAEWRELLERQIGIV
jgi:Glycosyl transferases group 1